MEWLENKVHSFKKTFKEKRNERLKKRSKKELELISEMNPSSEPLFG